MIVLGAIVLVLGLALAMFLRASAEMKLASATLSGAENRTFPDLVVNLVQGQIHHATTQGINVAWASQPGMVRTFNNDGSLRRIYKLYSAANLSDANAVNLTEDLPPAGWADTPALWTDLNAPEIVGTNSIFPILDPGDITESGGASTNIAGFGITNAPGATAAQPAPMPVRWLYVLEDGSLVAPTGSGSTLNVANASQNNKIVGRVAFWTDDDTAKININTASKGTYFDMPRHSTQQDAKLGAYQPVLREFQRYPGHPSTVNLGAALGSDLSEVDIYNKISPRVVSGGSQQGSVVATNAITLSDERLYASVDELIHDPGRKLNSVLNRPPDDPATARIERARFFLTASSRAPELNLYNLPRIAFWPLSTQNDNDHRTIHDRLIAFASTINNFPYYFQRANSASPTSDYDDILRNQQLYGYLQNLTSRDVPGFGGNFSSKFGSNERNQILTEIFDYIRSANISDDNLPVSGRYTKGRLSDYGLAPTLDPAWRALGVPGFAQVTPIQINGTQGFGRIYTLSEVAFQFIATGDGSVDTSLRVDNQNKRKASRFAPGVKDANPPEYAALPQPEKNLYQENLSLPANTMLADDERSVQMMMHFQLTPTADGYPMLAPDMTIEVEGLQNLTLNGQPLFPVNSGTTHAWVSGLLSTGTFGGGPYPFFYPAYKKYAPARAPLPADPSYSANFSLDHAQTPKDAYPFISVPVIVNVDPANLPASRMTFASSGPLTVRIYSGRQPSDGARFADGGDGSFLSPQLVQTITLDLPASSALPVPNLMTWDITNGTTTIPAEYWWSFTRNGAVPTKSSTGRFHGAGKSWFSANTSTYALLPGPPIPNSYASYHGYLHSFGSWILGHAYTYKPSDPSDPPAPQADVVRSMVVSHGDHRLVAGKQVSPSDFVALGNWDSPNHLEHTLSRGMIQQWFVAGWERNFAGYVPGLNYGDKDVPGVWSPMFHKFATANPSTTGDWDAGLPYSPDGAYINMPDHGAAWTESSFIPYLDYVEKTPPTGKTFFTPNRIMPSPAMMGSLPTGVVRERPWETLLLRPQTGHPNDNPPPDYLLLDLFWMPVVEPYAISEPFSTAGKINMNYQILPFTYIERSTGLHATLDSEKVIAVPDSASTSYKTLIHNANPTAYLANTFRFDIDIPETLSQFQTRFNTGDIFRTAAEICSLHLVPQGTLLSGMNTYWNTRRMTADNLRERPYTLLLPKLTTRSNTFTVHLRVQRLKHPANLADGQWEENPQLLAAEYRGSVTMERYIDPADPDIPDYATANLAEVGQPTGEPALDSFYKWRIIANRQFAP